MPDPYVGYTYTKENKMTYVPLQGREVLEFNIKLAKLAGYHAENVKGHHFADRVDMWCLYQKDGKRAGIIKTDDGDFTLNIKATSDTEEMCWFLESPRFYDEMSEVDRLVPPHAYISFSLSRNDKELGCSVVTDIYSNYIEADNRTHAYAEVVMRYMEYKRDTGQG